MAKGTRRADFKSNLQYTNNEKIVQKNMFLSADNFEDDSDTIHIKSIMNKIFLLENNGAPKELIDAFLQAGTLPRKKSKEQILKIELQYRKSRLPKKDIIQKMEAEWNILKEKAKSNTEKYMTDYCECFVCFLHVFDPIKFLDKSRGDYVDFSMGVYDYFLKEKEKEFYKIRPPKTNIESVQ